MYGEIRQNLSVHTDAGLLQSENKLVVVQAVRPRGRTDAYNPQPAEVAFLDAPVTIGVAQCFFDRLFCKFVQLALVEVIALRKAEQLLTAIMPFSSTFNSRQFLSSLTYA